MRHLRRESFVVLWILFCTLVLVARDVPYVRSPEFVVERMLKLAGVKADDVVYDLGCGDGRIVIAAARDFGARGVGIDIDRVRVQEATNRAKLAGVTDRTTFITRDVFDAKFDDATVVCLFMLPEFNLKLRPRLLAELKPGTRVVAHTFDMGDWKPDKVERLGGVNHILYLWTVPANVAGVWDTELETPDGGKRAVQLNVRQKYQEVSGTARIGGKTYEMVKPTLAGDEITFGIVHGLGGRRGKRRRRVIDGAAAGGGREFCTSGGG